MPGSILGTRLVMVNKTVPALLEVSRGETQTRKMLHVINWDGEVLGAVRGSGDGGRGWEPSLGRSGKAAW